LQFRVLHGFNFSLTKIAFLTENKDNIKLLLHNPHYLLFIHNFSGLAFLVQGDWLIGPYSEHYGMMKFNKSKKSLNPHPTLPP
jgi:hypothetical protein